MSEDNQTALRERLLALSRKLHQGETPAGLLQEITDAAADLTSSAACALWLFEEETQQLALAASCTTAAVPDETRLPVENSLAGAVYQQIAPITIEDMAGSPLTPHPVERSVLGAGHALMAAPVTFSGKPLGVLVTVKDNGTPYTLQDQQTLDILAGYAGVAVQLQRARESIRQIAAERAELNRQKTDFIAITSHELRTPLGLVLGHATFLREIIPEESYRKQLEVIVRNAERLKEIIDSLNQARNFEHGTASIHHQRTSLNTLLQTVTQSFAQEAAENEIDLQIALPEEDVQVECDPGKLGVALGNVIQNAIIFSDAGDRIAVGLHQLRTYAMISVTDTGIGIPASDLHQIFERFYQVERHLTRTHGGMGLGLSVSKAIIESHGGQIWVESQIGEGSTFTILLPMKHTDG